MRNIALFGGSSHPTLAAAMASRLGIPIGQCDLGKFSNKETSVQMKQSVRNLDVYVVQSGCGHVNDHFIELLIMISACKMASAAKVTAVLPCFPYARQPDVPYLRSTRSLHPTSLQRAPPPPLYAPHTTSAAHHQHHSTTPADAAAKRGGYALRTSSSASIYTTDDEEDAALQHHLSHAQHPHPHAPSSSPSHLQAEAAAQPYARRDSDPMTSPSADPSPSPARTQHAHPLHSSQRTPTSPLSRSPPASVKAQTASAALDGTAAAEEEEDEKMTAAAMCEGPIDGIYRHWQARSGTLIANMLMTAGADHIITLDLHDPQFQGYFDIPVDNLYCEPLMVKYIKDKIPNWRDAVIVSPDAGGAKRATQIADVLGLDFALIHKGRRRFSAHPPNATPSVRNTHNDLMLVGDVKDKPAILIDDIADTSHTITRAANMLHQHGSTRIYALVTHAILSGDAVQRIKSSKIDELIVSNSIPQEEHVKQLEGRCKVFDIAPIFAEAVRRIHNGESVSYLFDTEMLI